MKLYELMLERGVSTPDLADFLNIHESILLKKMRGELPWYLTEVAKMCNYLGTSDVVQFVQLDSKS